MGITRGISIGTISAIFGVLQIVAHTIWGHELIPRAQLAALRSALKACTAAAIQQLEASLSRYDHRSARKALVEVEWEIR
jgi:hypothetical protein